MPSHLNSNLYSILKTESLTVLQLYYMNGLSLLNCLKGVFFKLTIELEWGVYLIDENIQTEKVNESKNDT